VVDGAEGDHDEGEGCSGAVEPVGIWDRQRHLNALRATLRGFYPAALAAFGTDLAHPDALGVLAAAPTPERGRRLSVSAITAALRRGGRKRYFEHRARGIQIALRSPQLAAPEGLADAYGASVAASVAIIAEMTRQIAAVEDQLTRHFDAHPDAEIIRSLPGLGDILGARVLGRFGDDPTRYQDAKARKNYAGTAPITRASGNKRTVLARFVRNRHLADACCLWAFCALTASPGAKAYYDAHKARGDSHDQALRALGNRLGGILDGCLRHRCNYDETVAWGHRCELDHPAASAARKDEHVYDAKLGLDSSQPWDVLRPDGGRGTHTTRRTPPRIGRHPPARSRSPTSGLRPPAETACEPRQTGPLA